ncbi:MAG: AAA family ATPase [Acidobacteriota bacterium]|nr:MAG: AAA family ATPase [Acidobacteriota bacterium]
MSERISEPERYDSAAGWQPPDPYKKLREKARRELERTPDPSSSMLAVRPASKWIVPAKPRPTPELLSSLWRQGEIAVMFGERGCGKSIFAVQTADAIAKGNSPLNSPRFDHAKKRVNDSGPRPPKVLYIDFEMSDQQFSTRYCAHPPESKRMIKPKFAFDRAVIDPEFELPKAFRKVSDFLYHSIRYAMTERENGVVIVDSIHYLLRDTSSRTGSLSLMKTLRQITSDCNVSILITAPMHPRTRVTRPVTLKDLAAARCVAELSDTVFALCHSTLSPAHRYIKHLASRHAPIIHDTENVLALHLTTAPKAAPALDSAPASASAPAPAPAPCLPVSPSPGLPISPSPHLAFLGPTPELPHITDYAAETERRITQEANRLRRLRNPRNVVEILMSPDYHRYIKGE